MMDNPTDEQIVAALAGVEPALVAVPEIVAAVGTSIAGYVVWDASIPMSKKIEHHTTWLEHRATLVDAFLAGFAFCRTDLRNEWLVLGQMAMLVVRSLSSFVPAEPRVRLPLVYVGTLNTFIRVYVPMQGQQELVVKSSMFYAGVGRQSTAGSMQNMPLNMME
jgi:hypothetical protein